MIVKLILVCYLTLMGMLNILSLGKTVVVHLLCGVAARVTCLLLHKVHLLTILISMVCLYRLILPLLNEESILGDQVGVGHIMVSLRILIYR